jgi:membrane-bound serine protease (ClpP class)
MRQKIENDAAAFLRSYVQQHHRNLDAAEKAVRQSAAYSAQEALDKNLIEIIATDRNELIRKLDGRTIQRPGGNLSLHTASAEVTVFQPNIRENVLNQMMDPNLALLTLFAGALLIYLEFHVPGTIIPGALGTLLVLIALFSLNLLPLRFTAIAMLVAALVLIVLEAKYPSHGALAIAGICALVLGSLTLVAAPIPEMAIHLPTALALALAFGVITLFLLRLAFKAQRMKSLTGADALIGQHGVALDALSPDGQVLVHGEIWRAIATSPIAKGEVIKVNGAHQLVLKVTAEK